MNDRIMLGTLVLEGRALPQDIEFVDRCPQQPREMTGGGAAVEGSARPDSIGVRWQGTFQGREARSHADAIERLAQSRAPVSLSLDGQAFTVIVVRFEADFRCASDIPYRIECVFIGGRAMRAPLGRLLLPDAFSLKSPTSLARARRAFTSPKAQSDLEHQLKELLAALAADIAATAAQLREDPFVACVFAHAAQSDLALYVPDQSKPHYYQIDPAAIREERRGFLVGETIADGHFAVVPSLMLNKSREAQLCGQPIFVSQTQLDGAFKLKPISRTKLVEVIKEVIDEAKSQGVELSREQLVTCVRKRAAIRSVAKREIQIVAKPFWPPEWSRPGPKRKPSVGR